MHDSIEMEKRGIPSAAICTDQFIPTARAMAAVGGLPDYPFATIQHPIGSMPDEQLKRRAEIAAPQVRDILLKK